MVRKIPACAVSPKRKTFGFASNGVKSHMAPTAMSISSGNISVAMPRSKNICRAPCTTLPPSITWSSAEESGRLTSIVPKPIGSSRLGSKFFLTAMYIRKPPTHIITKL